MKYYSGLDVSLKETFITIINQDGEIVKEQVVPTSAGEISKCLINTNFEYKKIGIESGQFSISLCKDLVSMGLPVICVDARSYVKSIICA
ncbi:MAG: hypothetical protein SFT93_04600, partial [Rickettsiaceae bacterium]|nr:hypothetical protein [Rickettsiaceae bacterium]